MLQRQHWVFDMDGTLTRGVHDFDAIRRELGITGGAPIIEALNAMPAAQSAPLWRRLNELELHYARLATPMPHALECLNALQARGVRLGIVTRNTLEMAVHTLKACGMLTFFAHENIIDRDGAVPKPSPAGIHKLMHQWQCAASDTVMIGDYYYDLKAGRDAGVATIHLDEQGEFPWPEETDMVIRSFSELNLI